jgi:Skp family chaperone for outer membrane proteins
MAAFVASQAQDKPAAGPPRLGVVDLSKCFDKTRYEEIKDIDEELQKMAEGIARKLREADGGDPKELQKLRERLKGEYLVFYNRKKAEIYNEIRAIVDIIGRERGHTLVLRKESPRLEGDENESVGALIGQRVVLFHDPAIDITDEVLKRLNAAYAAKKGKKEKDF